MSRENPNKCAHPACGCPKEKQSNYCSQSCEEAAHPTDSAYHCGHPGCLTPRA
jgi:hypothetical protein